MPTNWNESFLNAFLQVAQIVQTCWRWMCWMQPDFDLLFGRMHVWFSSDSDFMFPTFLCCLVLCWVMYFVQRKQNISDYPVPTSQETSSCSPATLGASRTAGWGGTRLAIGNMRLLGWDSWDGNVENVGNVWFLRVHCCLGCIWVFLCLKLLPQQLFCNFYRHPFAC